MRGGGSVENWDEASLNPSEVNDRASLPDLIYLLVSIVSIIDIPCQIVSYRNDEKPILKALIG